MPDELTGKLPATLEELRRRFSSEATCAGWLEKMRWGTGFQCPTCNSNLEPYRFSKRPSVLRCRTCKRDVSLTAGTPLQGSHVPLQACIMAAYSLIENPAMTAAQLQRAISVGRFDPASRLRTRLVPMAERISFRDATFEDLACLLLGAPVHPRGWPTNSSAEDNYEG